MKKLLKILAILFIVGFFVIQLFRPNFTNPPIAQGASLEENTQVPPDIQNILSTSCNDCHSNKTVYPWYSQIAPASWFLADHIKEGRSEVNFSEWGSYETKKRIHKLEEVCELVESRAMPLPSYLWIHGDAALSESQIKTVCDWTKQEISRLKSN